MNDEYELETGLNKVNCWMDMRFISFLSYVTFLWEKAGLHYLVTLARIYGSL
jgi:hypothetical protein